MRNITVITGASSGMGREFARQLYSIYQKNKTNNEIWLIARTTEKLEEVQKELPDTELIQTKAISMDLCGAEGSRNFSDLLEREYSASPYSISLLINNAGFGTYGPFAETPAEEELRMIDVNCTALTGICSSSIKKMNSSSIIINVSSLAAFMPLGNFAVYAATKAYVLSFSLALAAELKEKGIKVCALCPGSVSTNFANVASNGARKEVLHGRDPVKVVRHCLKKAFNGKKIIQTFAKWRITAFLSRFAGRYFIARMTYLFNKRPRQNQPL